VLHYLWGAVAEHWAALDILMQEQRDGVAAKRFFKRLLQALQYEPKRIITDGLRKCYCGAQARNERSESDTES
jgi:putative transposase